eukprot:gene1922-2179_t
MPPNTSATEVETLLLLQEIEDVIDESPMDFVSIEEVVLKLQEQRMSLRRYDILLNAETSDSDLPAKITDMLIKIKEYIKYSKDRKQKLNLLQTKQLHEEAFPRKRSTLFVITDLRRIITDLINDCRIVLEKLTDIELLQLKSELPIKCELMNKAAKNADSLANALSKIVNMMKEVMLLAETHKIEEYLHFGDGIQRIYAHLGDSLLSKWLSNTDETNSPKDIWLKFVEFLEKEQRLQQQKLIILNSNVNSKGKPPDHSHNKDKEQGFIVSLMTPICSICQAPDGTSDRTSSSGPNGSRIIQYHTYKKFVDLTPANRLSLLKERGFCFQYLYPGADTSSSKHKEGRCQRDFICKHECHERYSTRKHVLVCEEHRTINPTRTSLKSINNNLLEVPAYHYLLATSVFCS